MLAEFESTRERLRRHGEFVENQLTLQISLGLMDHRDRLLTGGLTGEQLRDLSDLIIMSQRKFFAGSDEYTSLYGIDGALSRFRQSRFGRAVEYVRNRRFAESNLGGKILTLPKVIPDKIELKKIS